MAPKIMKFGFSMKTKSKVNFIKKFVEKFVKETTDRFFEALLLR